MVSARVFSRSNRNDREIPVPFANSHLIRFTSAPFPAFRQCRCGRHFDLLLFSSNRERLGPGETPDQKNPVPTTTTKPLFKCLEYLAWWLIGDTTIKQINIYTLKISLSYIAYEFIKTYIK